MPNVARHLLCVPGGMAEHRSGADLNKLTELIIGAAIEVHREQGAGLLESAYLPPLEAALRARRQGIGD